MDELDPAYRQFNIISVRQGEIVSLIQGDLKNGLGGKKTQQCDVLTVIQGAYSDYIEVRTREGKMGKISRLVVQLAV